VDHSLQSLWRELLGQVEDRAAGVVTGMPRSIVTSSLGRTMWCGWSRGAVAADAQR
jgi:hypothetical protein